MIYYEAKAAVLMSVHTHRILDEIRADILAVQKESEGVLDGLLKEKTP